MQRSKFIKLIATLPLVGYMNKLSSLEKLASNFATQDALMPILFLGHGSPMNAIEDNEFVQGFEKIAQNLPKPNAILCVSAHWETKGTFVTSSLQPKTIHDFGGFPKELFEVEYPALGSLELATETKNAITNTTVGFSDQWGLDHGCWSVVKHLYPNADVPIVQLSIDYTKDATYHYELAKQIAILRKKGILIVGSGNMVHNLGMVAWDKMNEPNYGFDWAKEANEKMKQYILNDNHDPLIKFNTQGLAFNYAIPTPEHYLPLLYILALKNKNENINLFNDKYVAGSLSMTSVMVG